MNDTDLRNWLERRVSPARYRHSLGVYEAVGELAGWHDVDGGPLRIAALLHDCARELPPRQLLEQARSRRITIREVDRESPVLLHGRLAAQIAGSELGISNPEVASAVSFHTAGHLNMSLPDKLFFLADHIEPTRSHIWVEELRAAAQADVDAAVLRAIEINLRHLRETGKTIDPDTLALKAQLERDH
jgi:predicted HD superfamily hydrolase involved in NAD metabolism